jgi:hypothetical protein
MATSRSTSRSLTLRRIESIDAGATVRHVDELDEQTLAAFYGALEGARPLATTELDLEPGTVVVATDYVRLERT